MSASRCGADVADGGEKEGIDVGKELEGLRAQGETDIKAQTSNQMKTCR
jgi:hypothetical protein